MPSRAAFVHTTRPSRRAPRWTGSIATVAGVIAILALPALGLGGGMWARAVAWQPALADPCYALACVSLAGCTATLAAGAIRDRRVMRPALRAAIATVLLAPAGWAVPLWPGLLAAAGLLTLRAPCEPIAANDNAAPAPRNPLAVAA